MPSLIAVSSIPVVWMFIVFCVYLVKVHFMNFKVLFYIRSSVINFALELLSLWSSPLPPSPLPLFTTVVFGGQNIRGWAIFSHFVDNIFIVKVGKVASFVGKIFMVRLSTSKTTNILPHENYPLYGNMFHNVHMS